MTWKYSGTNQGCSYNAGPVTFQVRFGRLDGLASGARVEHLPGQAGPGLLRPRLEPPAGPRTITCPTATSTTTMRPHEFLKTGDPTARPDVPGDGVLKGSWTNEEHSGGAYHETYDWRLEPQP